MQTFVINDEAGTGDPGFSALGDTNLINNGRREAC